KLQLGTGTTMSYPCSTHGRNDAVFAAAACWIASVSPLSNDGIPQHRCSGMTTSTPFFSTTCTSAFATSVAWYITRLLPHNATFRAAEAGTAGPPRLSHQRAKVSEEKDNTCRSRWTPTKGWASHRTAFNPNIQLVRGAKALATLPIRSVLGSSRS